MSDLQLEVQRLNLLIQQQLVLEQKSPKKQKKSKHDVQKVLKKRIAHQFSDDGVSDLIISRIHSISLREFPQHSWISFQSQIIYTNGVTIPADLAKQLETISGEPGSDRVFINSHFPLFFPAKYVRKQVKKGLSREEILNKFRSSDRYATMKGRITTRQVIHSSHNTIIEYFSFHSHFRSVRVPSYS